MSQEPTEPYVGASTFADLLTSPTRVKILDVLLRKHYTELTVKELTEFIEADRVEICAHLEILVANGLVVESENTTDPTSHEDFTDFTYKINKNDITVKTMRKLQTLLLGSTGTDTDDNSIESINVKDTFEEENDN